MKLVEKNGRPLIGMEMNRPFIGMEMTGQCPPVDRKKNDQAVPGSSIRLLIGMEMNRPFIGMEMNRLLIGKKDDQAVVSAC